MKNEKTADAWKPRALEAEAHRNILSRQLQRELRVIQVLITLGAVKEEHVEKARQMVDDLSVI